VEARAAGKGDAELGGVRPANNSKTNARTRNISSLAANSVNVTAAIDLAISFCQHHRDPSGQDCCLAGSGPSFDEEGAIVRQDGSATRGVIGKRSFYCLGHWASQTSAASPRRSAIA